MAASWTLLQRNGVATPDVCVYGASMAGVIAAIAAARQDKKVLLISENERLGGVFGWGITSQDIQSNATPAVIAGISRELLSSIGRRESNGWKAWQRYCRVSCVGRPSWFARAVNRMVAAEKNITVFYSGSLESVYKNGTRLEQITLSGDLPSQTVGARTFIDASVTGDLIAAAGCSVAIGRESTTLYSESAAGIIAAAAWAGSVTINPYVTSGVASSGLLPGIDSGPFGTIGQGDGRVMPGCYRLFVTTASGDRIPFPDPDFSVYNEQNYQMLARAMNSASTSYDTVVELFQMYGLQTGSYFDMNSRSSIPASSNYMSPECKEYITATPGRRAVIRENAKQWLLGLLYWIRYSRDPRIPSGLITDIASYGLSDEELQAYGGFSPEFYVREGRRLVGDFVFDQNDMVLANGLTGIVAYGYYDIDSHSVRRVVVNGAVVPEGAQLTALATSAYGFGIPYTVLLPKATQCTNLWSPTCPSVSRVAWCSLRMEPLLMMLGEAAGLAAAQAVEQDIDSQDVSTSRLAVLQDPQNVWDGIVLNTDATYNQGTVTQSPAASWSTTTTRFGYIGASGLSDGNTGKGKTLKFAPNIQVTGAYRVMFKYPPSDTARATDATVTISHAGGTVSLTVNQLYPGGKGGDWEDMGVYTFRSGSPSADYALVDTTASTDFVVASAFKFVSLGN